MEYEKIDIGSKISDDNLFKYYSLDNGIVDANGFLYIFDRALFATNNVTTHELLAEYLKLKYYLRIAYFHKRNDGSICPDTTCTIKYPLDNFVINEKMTIALYNLINSKADDLTTFEEKLAKYATEFGYFSTTFKRIRQIYDYEMFNKNIKVLSYTLGNKFDRKFFVDILNK